MYTMDPAVKNTVFASLWKISFLLFRLLNQFLFFLFITVFICVLKLAVQ